MLAVDKCNDITFVHPIPGQTPQSTNEAKWPCQNFGKHPIKCALAVGKGLAHGVGRI